MATYNPEDQSMLIHAATLSPGEREYLGVTPTVIMYEVEDIGLEHVQYFTGRGIAYTEWEAVYVGTGDTAHEALENALDQAAMEEWPGIDEIENTMSQEELYLGHDEMHYYVALYVKGVC